MNNNNNNKKQPFDPFNNRKKIDNGQFPSIKVRKDIKKRFGNGQ